MAGSNAFFFLDLFISGPQLEVMAHAAGVVAFRSVNPSWKSLIDPPVGVS